MATIKGLLALFFKPRGTQRFVQYTATIPTSRWNVLGGVATPWTAGRPRSSGFIATQPAILWNAGIANTNWTASNPGGG